MEDKALHYLSLARKAGLAELGEEPVGAATRSGKAPLVLVASDASDHTWRRANSFVSGTEQICLRLPATKSRMGFAVGRTELALAAITDAALALALVRALEQPELYQEALDRLDRQVRRHQQRLKEAKAHQRNKRVGKPRRKAPQKQQ